MTSKTDTENRNSFLALATEAREAYFQFFSMKGSEIKRSLPDWLIQTIELIPRNTFIWDFERERNHQCYWEDFLQTLLLRSEEDEITYNTNTRVQLTPFGKHFGVGLNDKIPKFTLEQFHKMIGKKINFKNEEGYLVISFIN